MMLRLHTKQAKRNRSNFSYTCLNLGLEFDYNIAAETLKLYVLVCGNWKVVGLECCFLAFKFENDYNSSTTKVNSEHLYMFSGNIWHDQNSRLSIHNVSIEWVLMFILATFKIFVKGN
jgi:hypothetical protein